MRILRRFFWRRRTRFFFHFQRILACAFFQGFDLCAMVKKSFPPRQPKKERKSKMRQLGHCLYTQHTVHSAHGKGKGGGQWHVNAQMYRIQVYGRTWVINGMLNPWSPKGHVGAPIHFRGGGLVVVVCIELWYIDLNLALLWLVTMRLLYTGVDWW